MHIVSRRRTLMSMNYKYGIVNTYDVVANPNVKFVDLDKYSNIHWDNFTGKPLSLIEQKAPMRILSRGKAALRTMRATSKIDNPVVISHLPYMTAAICLALKLKQEKVKHMAFAFNFTRLPVGFKKNNLKRVFQDVDRFIVFSEYEKILYSDYFEIDQDRIKPVLWAQPCPPISPEVPPLFEGEYLCSIGGEGRDYNTLIKAAKINKIPLVVICRPHNLKGIDIPANVKVFCNIPLEKTWGIAKQSRGMILPIESPELCCGQITLVSAHMVGLPVITNNAYALNEYYIDQDIMCESKNEYDLSEKMEQAFSNKTDHLQNIHTTKETIFRHDRSIWVREIENFLDDVWKK